MKNLLYYSFCIFILFSYKEKGNIIQLNFGYYPPDSTITFDYENKSDSNYYAYAPEYAVLKKVEEEAKGGLPLKSNNKHNDTTVIINIMPYYEHEIYGIRITPDDSLAVYLNQRIDSLFFNPITKLSVVTLPAHSKKQVKYKLLGNNIFDSLHLNSEWMAGTYKLQWANINDYLHGHQKVKKIYQSKIEKFEETRILDWFPYHKDVEIRDSLIIEID